MHTRLNRAPRPAARVCALLLTLLATLVALPACDDAPAEEATAPWQLVAEDLPVALLGVWGSSARDVWAVGSDGGDGPWIVHFDGTAWRRIETTARGALWWVWGGPDGTVWMAGDAGLVLRLPSGASTPEVVPTPSQKQLFGIFPAPDGSVWAVGGDVNGQQGEVWRLEGQAFVVDASVPAEAAERGAFFKVWGRSAEDLWVVGLGGVALHRGADGAWAQLEVPAGRRLFTVHGTAAGSGAETVLAVGGFQSGLAVQAAAAGLTDRSTRALLQLNGVWVTAPDRAVAVGLQGAVYDWAEGAFTLDTSTPRTTLDWHAVYADPEGGVWTVGGNVVAPPLSAGMLGYRGAQTVPTLAP